MRWKPEYSVRPTRSERLGDPYTENGKEQRRAAFYSTWDLMYGRYLKEYKARKGKG